MKDKSLTEKTSTEKENGKTDNKFLLNVLDEGVFFLNPEFEIEDEFSPSILNLIDQKISAGQKFMTLLVNKVPENTIKNTHEFLNLMFRLDLDEDTVRELNPLQQVEFHYENTWGLWTSSKYLRFKFTRVILKDTVIRVLVTVKDISKEINLTKKLEAVEENTKKQMEWLVNILRVAPPLLKEFIDVSEIEMNKIDTELKNSRGIDDCKPIMSSIIRTVHQIRSNASLLNLNFFKDKLQAFESEIQTIKKKPSLQGSDFVPAVIQLGEVRRMLNEIKSLMQRFKHFSTSLRPTRRFESGILRKSLESIVETSAKKLGKKINFDLSKFDTSIIPYADQEIIREFLIILTRFSIFYGIEQPDERRSSNKGPIGILEIETFKERRIIGFKLRHDGRLIRIERLLQKTIDSEEEKISEENTTQLGSEVVRLLFMPSLATANLLEAEYGQQLFSRMEMAKKKLKMHGGKIKITFTSENFCEYTISLPKK